MRITLTKAAGAIALGGALLAVATPAAAEPWRDAHGYWHHGPPPHYAHRGYAHPAYVHPRYRHPVYGRPGYAHPGYRVVSGVHGGYRPGVFHRGCNSWWHWDRYRHRSVRVTNC